MPESVQSCIDLSETFSKSLALTIALRALCRKRQDKKILPERRFFFFLNA